ncbi:MAG: SH3 domain-containing protein [Alphaproteobacteria bacterium]|nr:SH3 domain-containing protein [Alphaproteobacteria bacterium]
MITRFGRITLFIFISIEVLLPVLGHTEPLPLPRFTSVRSARMNSRIGPGFDYAIAWNYSRKNLPVEIIEEYGQWRRIKDIDGDISWVYQALLGGPRTAIVRPVSSEIGLFVPLYASKAKTSYIISKIQKGAVATLKSCDTKWCYVNFPQVSGYVEQACLWGVYNNELLH